MAIVRLSKTCGFEMAHALRGYEGACRNIHGHSYQVEVCVWGEQQMQNHNETQGMLMDLKELKELIKRTIIDHFDHGLLLSEDQPAHVIEAVTNAYSHVHIMPYSPTSENLVREFATRIEAELPGGVQLHHIDLWETETSKASFYKDDQQ